MTKMCSEIARDFLVKYDLVNDQKNFLINRFITVSFPDPYPDDDLNIIGSVDDTPDDLSLPNKYSDRVYPNNRYGENSPYCIYIPCKEVMLKLMRACVKVTRPKDLWIMQLED